MDFRYRKIRQGKLVYRINHAFNLWFLPITKNKKLNETEIC